MTGISELIAALRKRGDPLSRSAADVLQGRESIDLQDCMAAFIADVPAEFFLRYGELRAAGLPFGARMHKAILQSFDESEVLEILAGEEKL